VPDPLRGAGLGELLVRDLWLAAAVAPPDLAAWRELVERIKRAKPELEIALVGKYIELPDAYLSVTESLKHAGWANGVDVKVRWVSSETLTEESLEAELRGARGVLVPGGFGHRGIEGKVLAARWAREHRIPYLGLCLGLQCAVIELARDATGSRDVNSTEFDISPSTGHRLHARPARSRGQGGTMRLGLYPAASHPARRPTRSTATRVVYERPATASR